MLRPHIDCSAVVACEHLAANDILVPKRQAE